ncbi:hypothetical protein ACWGNM_00780 [Streptomyces sp. NPDC055796]
MSFLVGLVIEMFSSESGSRRFMFTAGWLFVAVAMVAAAVCVVGLVVTALRSGRRRSEPQDAHDQEPSDDEVARAREAWRNALLERGIMPFLRDALADPTLTGSDLSPRVPGRIPNLRYTRPDFTSPGSGPDPALGTTEGPGSF